MLVAEPIAKVRRTGFVQGKAIKAICRELTISRKMVRKALRSNEPAFDHERSVQPMPKLATGRVNSTGCWRGTRPGGLANA